MKILLVSTLYPPHVIGGAEKAASLLGEALVRHGHDVVAVSLHPGEGEVVEERNGVRVYRLPLNNFYWPFGRKEKPNALLRLGWHLREIWNPTAARRVGEILDREAPDVVHTHNVCGFSLAVWREVKRRKIRLVHTMHDYYLLCSRSTLFRNGRNCEQRCVDCRGLTLNRKALSRLPDAVVSVSEYTLRAHTGRGYFQGVSTRVIYNIQPALVRAGESIHREEKASGGLVFGFIGKVEEEKGIETLLEATGKLARAEWRLKIAGKGLEGYVAKLKERFPDPRIEWLGFVEATEFYRGVDVVVLPSLWGEPLPYVCVESLHAKKALICAASGGIPEIAKLSEVVEFFPTGDASALAAKMDVALSSPQRWRECRLPEASRLAAFREEEVLAKYLAEYGW
jgi:glycosyltransferase involved in cell wall biosynthesis